ncbi:hypothetical protein BIY22_06500 [Vibrio panuliri]|uniref:Sulfatase N-terminal domain-containing protein n=1 Tax=Vibrio panuliri TaxID=1381081 RepID=A0A1Q9HJY9_9VIBR|nr:sulfatase-like hydrolase/transferase [Vibrio panuliri]OLQ90635.1 hypothetical protein BIY22_06500 [Vibrio panuliri]
MSWLPITLAFYMFFIRKLYSIKFSSSPYLNMGDFLVISILSALSLVIYTPAYLIAIILVMTVLWVDALLMFNFGMKVTLTNINVFSQGVSTFKGEFNQLLSLLKRFHWLISSYLFFISSIIFIYTNTSALLPISISSLIFTISKSKIKNSKTFLAWVVVAISISVACNYSSFVIPSWVPLIALLVLLLICIVKGKQFFSLKSLLHGFLIGNKLTKGSIGNTNKHILEKIAEPHKEVDSSNKSQHFGCSKGHNVLLFTVESMSEEAFEDSPKAQEILQLLENKASIEQFYSVSPNTNQAINQIYTSMYGNSHDFNLLPEIAKHHYQTSFMTTQSTKFFNMNENLTNAGFDFIYDLEFIKNSSKEDDYRLLDYLDLISEKLREGNNFIHLLNNETHSKYNVTDKSTYCRHSNKEDKGRYLNSVDESLGIIHTILKELKSQDLLSNTIVVITGDHGQSFGEEGYFTHSSATINQQVKIPLCIFNDSLPNISHKQGCLLDLLPTLFDALGIEISIEDKDGIDLFFQDRPYLLLYSDTKGYNSPSNISVISNELKYYADLIKLEYRLLDLDDKDVSGENINKNEIKEIIYQAVKKHNLLH